jgi:hypothetical protein
MTITEFIAVLKGRGLSPRREGSAYRATCPAHPDESGRRPTTRDPRGGPTRLSRRLAAPLPSSSKAGSRNPGSTGTPKGEGAFISCGSTTARPKAGRRRTGLYVPKARVTSRETRPDLWSSITCRRYLRTGIVWFSLTKARRRRRRPVLSVCSQPARRTVPSRRPRRIGECWLAATL